MSPGLLLVEPLLGLAEQAAPGMQRITDCSRFTTIGVALSTCTTRTARISDWRKILDLQDTTFEAHFDAIAEQSTPIPGKGTVGRHQEAVPQWMFDPTICCRMELAAVPIVSCEALLDLNAVLPVGVSRKYGRHLWCARACAGSESVLGLIGLDSIFFGLSQLLLGFLMEIRSVARSRP